MGKKIDIGAYFDKLTRQGSGGRRDLDDAVSATVDETSPKSTSPTPTPRSSTESGSSGGLGGRLRDITKKTIDKATSRSRRSPTPKRPAETTWPKHTRPGGSAVAIEYSPNRDSDPDPGEVVWTWVPYEEDPTQGKDRPVVVIGRRGSKLVGVPLTSKPDDREAQVNVGTGGWDPQQRVSYGRIWRMLDIDPGSMRREGAVLDRPRFDEVVAAVDHYYDVTYPKTARKSAEAPDF